MFNLGVALAITAAVPFDPPMFEWDRPIVWKYGVGPEPREHPAIIVDEERDRALVIGGSGYHPQLRPLADVWELSFKSDTWRRLQPKTSIPSGGSRRVACVPGRKEAYLFGGYGAGMFTNRELVRVDFSSDVPTFETIPQDKAPQTRCLHAFAYDPTGDQFLLFGGYSFRITGAEPFNDLWSMKLVGGRAKWTRLDADVAPSPRYGFAYGYDAAERRLVVFSGGQGGDSVNPAEDTWMLSLAGPKPVWKRIERPGPRGRRNPCFAYDVVNKQLFVFSGTADARSSEPGFGVFDVPSESWIVAGEGPGHPHRRSSGAGIPDAKRRRVLLGFGNDADPFPDLHPLKF
jgi:hypothetical protein